MRRTILVLFIEAVAMTTLLYITLGRKDAQCPAVNGSLEPRTWVARTRTPSYYKGTPKEEFVIIFCQAPTDKPVKLAINMTRQLRQVTVLLKSAAALTSTTLKFNIVTDTNETYHQITNTTSSWPQEYRSRLIFDNTPVFYPPKTDKMRNMFRPCATERLFLPQVYPQKDAIIFLDTDILFMQPPEDLWKEFENFEDRHIVGISPCLYMYGPNFKKFATFGSSGINAGVILMNLSRLHNFPGGWPETILNVTKIYKGKLQYADQDILNIIFSKKRSSLLYELGCEWNYRQKVCSEGWNKCPGAASRGVSLLHGAAMTFLNGDERQFQAVFEAWEKYQLGRPLTELLELLEAALNIEGFTKGCGELSNIKNILLKGLQRHIRLQNEEKNLASCL